MEFFCVVRTFVCSTILTLSLNGPGTGTVAATSIDAMFNDSRCTDGTGVCPTDSLLFTCEGITTMDNVVIIRTDTNQQLSFNKDGIIGASTLPHGITYFDSTLVANATSLQYEFSLHILNASQLNNMPIICDPVGDDEVMVTCSLAGDPSAPGNLREAPQDDTPSIMIEWNPPGEDGNPIETYRIQIPNSNYVDEETGSARSHNVTADGSDILFSTSYQVQVTAVDICGLESDPARINISIEASEPPEIFLDTALLCSAGNTREVDLTWTYGIPSPTVYTPSTNNVAVEVDGSAVCSGLSPSDMNCSFSVPVDGVYTVTLTTTNEIGKTSNETTFDSTPLMVDDTPLSNTGSPHILVSVNPLCQNIIYTLTVAFTTRPSNTVGCEFSQGNDTTGTIMRSSGYVRIDVNVVGDGGEYCYRAVLSTDKGVIDEVEGTGGGGGGGSGDDDDDEFPSGLVVGIVCGVFGFYSGVMSSSASNMYWLLPLVAGLSGSLTALIAVGMVTSIALFPIGIVLLIVTCCCCHGNKSNRECYDSSYHNPTIATTLFCIGVVTSIILFPLGIAALIVSCFHKERARCVVISFGIAGCVMVFPIGLVLLFVSYCCCPRSKSDDQSPMQFQDLSNCHKALVYIGAVASAIIFPVGLVILIYHLCCEGQPREKDDQEMKNLRSGSSPDPESPPFKEPPPTGPMYQDPSTIEHVAHPETGETYAVVQQSGKKKKKGRKEEEPTGPMYQDPKTIEHQQAEGGELYALPDSKKKKKKGKKGEESKTDEELAQMYSMPDKSQKQKSEGLTYADIDLHASSKQPPAPKTSEYADIQHPQ